MSGVGGVGSGLLPNVAALVSTLLRRACTDDSPSCREVAARVLHGYAEWWPVTTLQQEGRRLICATSEPADVRAGGVAVRAIELLLAMPCNAERCAPLPVAPIDWSVIFDADVAERIHLAPSRPSAPQNPSDPPLPFRLIECVLGALPSLSKCTALRSRLQWLLNRPALSAEAAERQQRWLQLARDSGDAGWEPAAIAANEDVADVASGAQPGQVEQSVPVLSDWVRWEMRSQTDASTHARSLDRHCRDYLCTHALVAVGGDVACLAEDLFVAVALQLATSAAPRTDSLSSPCLADDSAAARERLLRVCAELGETASACAREVAEATDDAPVGAGGATCWLVRALLRLSETAVGAADGARSPTVAAEAVEGDVGADAVVGSSSALTEEQWHGLASSALLCVGAIPWEALAPQPPPADAAAADELHMRLLCAPLVHASPSLLAECVLALARRKHAQPSAASATVPSLLRRAVIAAPQLPQALRCCSTELRDRARTMPHLLSSIDEQLLALATSDASTAAAVEVTSPGDGPATLIAPRKRKHPDGEPSYQNGHKAHAPSFEARLNGGDSHAA